MGAGRRPRRDFNVLREHGHAAIASDICDYDFPLHFVCDFLTTTKVPAGVELINDPAIVAGAIQSGEDMRSDRTVGIADGDRNIQDRLEGLSQIETLRFAADEDRYRLEIVGKLTGLLGGGTRVGVGRDHGLARGRDRALRLRAL